MPPDRRPALARYGLAVLTVLLTVAARLALQPVLGEREAFLPFSFAILMTVIWCGTAEATAAAALSLAFGCYFSGIRDIGAADLAEAATFVLTATGIILVGGAVNRARRAAIGNDRRATIVAEELNLLIDGAHGHAIYMLDPGGHVTIWNKGAERLKGWHEAEVIGQHTTLFYPPDAIAANKPETHRRLLVIDTIPSYQDPATFRAQIERSLVEWTAITNELNLTLDS